MRQNGLLTVLLMAVLLAGCAEGSDSDDLARPALQSFTAGGDSGHLPIRNVDGGGDARDTGMRMLAGDQVTIEPLAMVRYKRAVLPPEVTRPDNEVCVQNANVCVATVPVIEHQCHDHCRLCQKCLVDFIGLGCTESVCCESSCQDVHTRDQCVGWTQQCTKQQNQWTETSLFLGLDSPEASEEVAPMSSKNSTAALLAGLRLRLSYSDENGSPKQAECPLAAFKPRVEVEKFILQMRDVPGCPPLFVDHPEIPRQLGLINALSEIISYPVGSRVRTWDGRTLEQPKTLTYPTEIDLSVTITIQGEPAAG